MPALLVVVCARGVCKHCFCLLLLTPCVCSQPRPPPPHPGFAPHSLEVAFGLLVFLYLVVHNLPQLLLQAVIFYLYCLRKSVQVQALQQRVPGSSLFHLHEQLGGPALSRLNSSISSAQENGSKFCVPPSHSAYLLKDKISHPWHCQHNWPR